MSASFFDMMKYAATGIAAPSMTYYDRMRASTLMGGAVQTLTGIPPLSFKSNGKPLISWSMLGNAQQTGTPTPDNPVMPEFCGVMTGNLFNTDDETNGKYLTSDGSEGSAGTYAYTTYIPVIGGEKYTISKTSTQNSSACHCWYDADKQFISSNTILQTTVTLTAPASAAFLRCSYRKETVPEVMLNLGSTALPYEPYGWAEKITCAGQTTPVYLGQVQTVRRVKKLVLTGEEANWYYYENATSTVKFFYLIIIRTVGVNLNNLLNTHGFNMAEVTQQSGNILIRVYAVSEGMGTVEEWKAYLAAQYAAGTPVTIWYVIAEPETAIVNEPLAKIGDYADELSSTVAGVSIPTTKGQNTLTVDTELKPSEMTIRYKA